MVRALILVLCLVANRAASGQPTTMPADYRGKPFQDSTYKAGPQCIPGIVQCALYDLGGEGVAYHDSDEINRGSGELNVQPLHQRPHAGPYIWGFRKEEGVDLSYVKDFADLNHANAVSPLANQFYIGWTKDQEWVNYTVDVKAPGTYRIRALYAKDANTIRFDVNRKLAAACKLPVATEGYHTWNYAEIGTIIFPHAGLHLLTFHYGAGNNFAIFEFEKVEQGGPARQ